MEKVATTTTTKMSISNSGATTSCCNNNNIEESSISSSNNSDLVMFEHQVSGHGTAEKGLLKNKQGHILKPLQPPPKGQREVMFYEKVQKKKEKQHHGQGDDNEPCYYSELREFIPEYFGVVDLQSGDPTDSLSKPPTTTTTPNTTTPTTPYIILSDTLSGLTHPCVMDLKIGARTWSPDASEAKIKQEMSKYRGTKGALGLCLTGMHYYRVKTCSDKGESGGYSVEATRLGRDEGKGLDAAGFKIALERYFNLDNHDDRNSIINIKIKSTMLSVLQEVIKRLRRIEAVFEKQTGFRVYGSSILVAYDVEGVLMKNGGGGMVGGSGGANNDSKPPNESIRVNMIDFAHYHEAGEFEKEEEKEGRKSADSSGATKSSLLLDENYLFGLRSLIRVLCDIVREKGEGEVVAS